MKRNHFRLRYLWLLLCLALLISGCNLTKDPFPSGQDTPPVTTTQSPAQETPSSSPSSSGILTVPEEIVPSHSPLSYEDIIYERPDLNQVYDTADQLLALTEEDGTESQILSLYDSLLSQLDHVSTMRTLASLKNSIDLSDEFYEEEMLLLETELTKMDNDMNEVTGAILDSPYSQAFTAKYGEEFVANYEFLSKLNSPEIEELVEQENKLVAEYNKLLSKEYTTTYQGKTVTINDLDFDDPDVATPYYEIYAKKNQACAPIYQQLVQIRVQIAKTLGYDSYTDYAYDCLGRDFTKEDATRFSQLAKEYITPVSLDLYYDYHDQIKAAEKNLPPLEEGIGHLQKALTAEFPAAMTEALDYMLEQGLYVFSDDPNSMPAAYSSILTEYATPFLYANTNYYTDPSTLFHEFGHYYNFYLMGNVTWYDSTNLDLAEIHSQGLELLMFDYYEEIYGKEKAEILQIRMLSDLLDTILMGCCEDAFQQAVFEDPDMTIDEMNLLHGQLYQEYLGYPVYYEWVDIHHHFETPFYYISYATSAASAFEIWELSQENRQDALAAYRSITQNTVNSGYREPLKRAGMSDPFTTDMVKDLAEAVREKFLPTAP